MDIFVTGELVMLSTDHVFELIGNTPLKRLDNQKRPDEANIFVKLEYLNPSGSLKDRIALQMIEDAEKSGTLNPGDTIVEASTGNTGIALSLVGTLKGYTVKIYMPELVSKERTQIMERYGAIVELVTVEDEQKLKEQSISGAEIEVPLRKLCLELEKNNSDIWWARQFSNPANVSAHHKTGKELLEQVGGHVDVFVASIGIEPASTPLPLILAYRDHGVRTKVTGGIIADIIDRNMVDDVIQITDHTAIEMAYRLVKEEGLFAGISAGANVAVALQEAKRLGRDKVVTTILPDSMDRYLTSAHFTT